MNDKIDLFDVVYKRLTNPDNAEEMVKRALAQGVVLDTWMNGEEKEQFSDDARDALASISMGF